MALVPSSWIRIWRRFMTRLAGRRAACPERQRALDLIAAVDAGGVPLNPARVNQIARDLGLEVSTRARPEDTIARIRAALANPPWP